MRKLSLRKVKWLTDSYTVHKASGIYIVWLEKKGIKDSIKRRMATGLCQGTLGFFLLRSCSDKVKARLLDNDPISDVTRQTGLNVVSSPARSSLFSSVLCLHFFSLGAHIHEHSSLPHHWNGSCEVTSMLLLPVVNYQSSSYLTYSFNRLFVEHLFCARSYSIKHRVMEEESLCSWTCSPVISRTGHSSSLACLSHTSSTPFLGCHSLGFCPSLAIPAWCAMLVSICVSSLWMLRCSGSHSWDLCPSAPLLALFRSSSSAWLLSPVQAANSETPIFLAWRPSSWTPGSYMAHPELVPLSSWKWKY